MLKIKEVDVFSFDTLRIGLPAYLKMFFLQIPLMIVPFGAIFYFNLIGWIASIYYVEGRAKFFSMDSLKIGWSVAWRYLLLYIPLVLISLIPLYVESKSIISHSLGLALFLYIVISSGAISWGWAIKRVEIVRKQLLITDIQPNQIKDLVRNVLGDSWAFAKKNWFVLLLATAFLAGITEAIPAFVYPFNPPKTDDLLTIASVALKALFGPAALVPMVGTSI